jgi:hypothetical protein
MEQTDSFRVYQAAALRVSIELPARAAVLMQSVTARWQSTKLGAPARAQNGK